MSAAIEEPGEILVGEIIIRKYIDEDGESNVSCEAPEEMSMTDVLGMMELAKLGIFYGMDELDEEE